MGVDLDSHGNLAHADILGVTGVHTAALPPVLPSSGPAGFPPGTLKTSMGSDPRAADTEWQDSGTGAPSPIFLDLQWVTLISLGGGPSQDIIPARGSLLKVFWGLAGGGLQPGSEPCGGAAPHVHARGGLFLGPGPADGKQEARDAR